MDISIFTNTTGNTSFGSRWFIYEVVGLGRGGETDNSSSPTRRSGRVLMRVPYSRMGQIMGQIARQGGKIISIKPLMPDSSPSSQTVESMVSDESGVAGIENERSDGETNLTTPEISNPKPQAVMPKPPETSLIPNQNTQPSAWWVEISTAQPKVIYYFGPFDSFEEAKDLQGGYIEDLEEEGALGITVEIKWCSPTNLTIF